MVPVFGLQALETTPTQQEEPHKHRQIQEDQLNCTHKEDVRISEFLPWVRELVDHAPAYNSTAIDDGKVEKK